MRLKGIFLLLVFFAFEKNVAGQKKKAKALNVIMIVADDMGYHLSSTGTKSVRTPNLDKLAAEGVLFSKAFSVAASCSPSRSSLLTGMYPHSNGHWRNTYGPELNSGPEGYFKNSPQSDIVGVRDWVQTMPEILNNQHYYTAITRKLHLSFPYKYPFKGKYPINSNEPDREAYFDAVSRIIADAKDQPFFIQANISPPHRPFLKYVDQYDGEKKDIKDIEVFPFLPDIPEVRQELLYYYTCVNVVDQIVGAILAALKNSGQENETLVIFTSDHGPAFHRAKATPYYAGMHVPLIIKGTGIKHGARNEELVSLIDLYPTILNYIGFQVPEQSQGKSLLPLLTKTKKTLPGRDYVFMEHNSHSPSWDEFYPSRAVFDGRYYLIENLMPEKRYIVPADLYSGKAPWYNLSYDGIMKRRDSIPLYYNTLLKLTANRGKIELYDMKTDAGQLHNLSDDVALESVKNRLYKKLTEWRAHSGDSEAFMQEMINSFKRKK